jgi:hypothetical protein
MKMVGLEKSSFPPAFVTLLLPGAFRICDISFSYWTIASQPLEVEIAVAMHA